MFSLALVVVEPVILPTATFAVSVVAALVAAWAAIPLGGNGRQTDVGVAVVRNLGWAVIPAVASPLLSSVVRGNIWLLAMALLYTSSTGTLLAFRHRTERVTVGRRIVVTVVWLAGSLLGVLLIIFVASRFGLTGA